MQKSILLTGVGGQGTILVSGLLTAGLMECGYDVKMSEIHGMAQRGGSVVTHVKYGDKVYSPLCEYGETDLLVSFEQVEAARYIGYLKKGGSLIVNDYVLHSSTVSSGVERYPDNVIAELKKNIENLSVIKADQLADELGNRKVQNVILLGVLAKKLDISVDWFKMIEKSLPARLWDINKKAFDLGYHLLEQEEERSGRV